MIDIVKLSSDELYLIIDVVKTHKNVPDTISIINEDKLSLPNELIVVLKNKLELYFNLDQANLQLTLCDSGLYQVTIQYNKNDFNELKYLTNSVCYNGDCMTEKDVDKRLFENNMPNPHIYWLASIYFLLQYYCKYCLKTKIQKSVRHEKIKILHKEKSGKSTCQLKSELCQVIKIDTTKIKDRTFKNYADYHCLCWGVRGYWQNRNGKQVFVRGYKKGKERNNPKVYQSKEYTL